MYLALYLGEISTGMDVINEVNLNILRCQVFVIALDSKQGFIMQTEIDDIFNNIQQRQINSQFKVTGIALSYVGARMVKVFVNPNM